MQRIWGYIPDELYADIEEIAKRESRKINPMITLLLQQAVKEKNRKRNGGQKNNTQHPASNVGESNTTG